MLPTTSFTEFAFITNFDAPAYDLYPLEPPRVLEVCSAGRVARRDGRPLDLAAVEAALVVGEASVRYTAVRVEMRDAGGAGLLRLNVCQPHKNVSIRLDATGVEIAHVANEAAADIELAAFLDYLNERLPATEALWIVQPLRVCAVAGLCKYSVNLWTERIGISNPDEQHNRGPEDARLALSIGTRQCKVLLWREGYALFTAPSAERLDRFAKRVEIYLREYGTEPGSQFAPPKAAAPAPDMDQSRDSASSE